FNRHVPLLGALKLDRNTARLNILELHPDRQIQRDSPRSYINSLFTRLNIIKIEEHLNIRKPSHLSIIATYENRYVLWRGSKDQVIGRPYDQGNKQAGRTLLRENCNTQPKAERDGKSYQLHCPVFQKDLTDNMLEKKPLRFSFPVFFASYKHFGKL